MRRLPTAIMFGSAVIAIPLTFATLVMAGFLAIDAWNGRGSPRTPLMVAAAPIAVIVPIVAFVTVVIGLPFHLAIRGTRYAGHLAYSLAGGIVGLAVPTVPVLLDGGFEGGWMALLGLVSGAATGHAWWRAGKAGAGEG